MRDTSEYFSSGKRRLGLMVRNLVANIQKNGFEGGGGHNQRRESIIERVIFPFFHFPCVTVLFREWSLSHNL